MNAQSVKSFGKASDLNAANMRKFDAEYEQESRMSDLLDVREMPKAVSQTRSQPASAVGKQLKSKVATDMIVDIKELDLAQNDGAKRSY